MPVIDQVVAASTDDAYHDPASWPFYSHTDTRVLAGRPGSAGPVWGGWRFDFSAAPIPPGAVITDAWVELIQAGYGYEIQTQLYLEDDPLPPPFSSTDSPFNRPRTTWGVLWPWLRTNPGDAKRTPSLAAGVQELVNRFGGILGLALIEDGTPVPAAPPGQYHEWGAVDGLPPQPARLHIEYTVGGSLPPPPVASAAVSPAVGAAPLAVGVADLSTGAIDTWTALWGDGQQTSWSTPPGPVQHVYTAPGVYELVWRVANAGGQSEQRTTITVNAPASDTTPPVVSGLVVTPGATLADVAWSTDEPAGGHVEYGTTAALGIATPHDAALLTARTVRLSGLTPETAYFYRVMAEDAAGNFVFTAVGTFTTAAAPPPPPPPAGSTAWPTRVDLAVAEAVTLIFSDGVPRSLRLDAYRIAGPFATVECDVSVIAGGQTRTQTLLVAGAGTPVVVNGLRLFPYVWKEADDGGLELAGQQGGLPLGAGKDVGFLVSDPALPMYRTLDSAYPFSQEFHLGTFFQNVFEENNPGEAHSGYDVGGVRSDAFLAPYPGTAYYSGNFAYTDPVSGADVDGQTTLVPTWAVGYPAIFAALQSWTCTHLRQSSALPSGTVVAAGARLAELSTTSTPPHAHLGSKGYFDGGSLIFCREMWQHHFGRLLNTPESWLVQGPNLGPVTGAGLGVGSEAGNIPADFRPAIGAAGWRLRSNMARAICRIGELTAAHPFMAGPDRDTRSAFTYAVSYVWAPAAAAGNLRFGLTHEGVIWLNGTRVFSGQSGRFVSLNTQLDPTIIPDQFTVPVTLQPGWNTLVIKTAVGSTPGRAHMFKCVVEAPGVTPDSFSTRAPGLAAVETAPGTYALTWTRATDYWTHVSRYYVDMSATPDFAAMLTVDVGDVAAATVTPRGTDRYIRLRPANDWSGTVTERVDVVEITAGSPPPAVATITGFSITPGSGVAPLAVSITAQLQNAIRYTLDVGAGSGPQTVLSSVFANTLVTYDQPGTYPVTLTAFDSAGGSAVATGTVTVTPPVAPSSAPSQLPPGGLAVAQVPQFVTFGWDDNHRAGGVRFVRDYMTARANPAGAGNPATFDGAQWSTSLYLNGENIFGPNINSPEWRAEYVGIYLDGLEIGNHGFSHDAFPDYAGWYADLQACDLAIVQMLQAAGIPQSVIDARQRVRRGVRAPFDAYSNAYYLALRDLGYGYSCSTQSGHPTNAPAWWPGTLEAGWPGSPTWEAKVTGNVPGVWEIPQSFFIVDVALGTVDGGDNYCEKDIFDPPSSRTGAQLVDLMKNTVLHRLATNRAPVSFCLHSQEWGPNNVGADPGPVIAERQAALQAFADWLQAIPEVRVVSHAQLLDWMAAPAPLGAFTPPTNAPPAVNAGVDITGQVGAPVAVNAAISDDPAQTHNATVDWGDGTPGAVMVVNNTAHTASASHVYAAAGAYTITVTAIDNLGLAGTDTLVANIAAQPPAVPQVLVSVEASIPERTTSANFTSAVLPLWNHASGFRPGPFETPNLVELARAVRVRTMRFGGGLWANAQGWTRDNTVQERYGGTPWLVRVDDDPFSLLYQQPHNYRHVYTPAIMDSVYRFKQAVGCDMLMQVNLLDNNPLMWADMVRYCNIERGYGFKYWELGNEWDYVKPFGSGVDHAATAREYVRRYARYYNAMLAVDPTVKLIGPVAAHAAAGNATNFAWADTFVAEMAARGLPIHAYSLHLYMNFGATGPDTADGITDPDNGWAPASVMSYNRYLPGSVWGAPGTLVPQTGGNSWLMTRKRQWAELMMAAIRARVGPDPEIWLSEWRWHAGDSSEPPHAHPVTLAWLMDVGMRLRRAGLGNLQYYNFYEEPETSGDLYGGAVSPTGVRPAYYALLGLNQLQGTQVLTAGSNEIGFGAHATRDARAVWVTLVNPNAEARDAVVTIGGLAGGAVDRVTVWHLQSDVPVDQIASGQQVHWNGYRASVGVSAEAELGTLYAAGQVTPVAGPGATIRLAPYGVAVCAFSNAVVPPPPPIAPVANVVVSPLGGEGPLTVTVQSDGSAGEIDTFRLDWGDGLVETFNAAPIGRSHVYTVPAVYSLRYSVTGPGGTDAVSPISIIVQGTAVLPPAAQFSGAPDAANSLLWRFVNLSQNATGFSWTFGDGTPADTSSNPQHTYPLPGSYDVTLTATGPGGTHSLTQTVVVTVPPEIPVALFSAVPDASAPRAVRFNNLSQNYVGASWDFGDQTAPVAEVSPVHEFAGPGIYSVTLTVTSATGNTAAYSVPVVIQEAPAPGGGVSTTVIVGVAAALIAAYALGSTPRRPG